MVHIQWKDRYNIGYKEIDDQHKLLLDVLNELIDMAGSGGDPELVTSIFHRLYEYVITHFATEERYMKACRYPRLAEHEAQHASFVQRMLELNNSFDPEDPHLLDETLEFVKQWYLDHILKSDLDYVPSMKGYHAAATIQGVIFDFSDVVCTLDDKKFLEGLSKLCDKSTKDLETELHEGSTLIQDHEAGQIGTGEFLARLSSLCGKELAEDDLIPLFADMTTPNQAVLDLIRKLKPRCKLGLLVNTIPWKFEYASRPAEVFALFDSVTLSYEVGARKPDPRLFEDAITKLDLMAEECIYIDHKTAFAQAATDHLMHGITYTVPLTLMAELRRHKVTF